MTLGPATGAPRRTPRCATPPRAGSRSVHECAGPTYLLGPADLRDALTVRHGPLPEVIGYWAEAAAAGGVARAAELGARGRRRRPVLRRLAGFAHGRAHAPYADQASSGGLRFDHWRLAAHSPAPRPGMQAGFHAIGDAAVDQILDAPERFAKLGRPRGRWHRIEHAEMVSEPSGSRDRIHRVRPARVRRHVGRRAACTRAGSVPLGRPLNRFSALAAAGVPLAFGSDAPVTRWTRGRGAGGAPPARRPRRVERRGGLRRAHGGWRGRRATGVLSVGAAATFAVWAPVP